MSNKKLKNKNNPNNRDTLDAWVILEHLYGAQRKDIRDYLIHQLYYLSDEDVDFFLPQLCTLLVVRDEDLSKALECYILHKCMKSIDFAIKSFWNLHAIQFYSKLESQRNRCDELRQNLEMIVVNGQLPRSLLMQIPSDIRQEIIKQETERPDRSPHSESLLVKSQQNKPEQKEQHNVNHSNNHNGHSKNEQNGDNKSLPQPQQKGNDIQSNGKHNNNPSSSTKKAMPSLSSALPKPKKPDNLIANDPILNGATEYLKKQRRCTYFNAELDFAHFLEGVSSALEQCDDEDRPRLLDDNIRYANKCLPRGLYIPIAHSASDPHKSLLRIVPKEGKCLDSKQKVPFLLFCEIEQHKYPTSSPLICEELTESDTALLASSGLYVLIDQHKGKKDKDKKKDKNDDKTKKKKDKQPHPKRLQPKVRKPSRPRLSFSRSKSKSKKSSKKDKTDTDKDKSPQSAKKTKSKLAIAVKAMPIQKSKSTPNPNNNTPTPPQVESMVSVEPEEYSISRTAYSEEDEDETKHSRSGSISPEQQTEPSQSVTSSHKPKAISIASFPSPKPKPRDEEADRNMGRHLGALLPFEPADHKAVKSFSSKYNNMMNESPMNTNNNERYLRAKDRNNAHSQSSSSLGVLSPNSKTVKFRSLTPEPDKKNRRGLFSKKRKNKNTDNQINQIVHNINNGVYQSKSDGNSTDSSAHHSPSDKHINQTQSTQTQRPAIIAQHHRTTSPASKRNGSISSPSIVVNGQYHNSPSLSPQSQPIHNNHNQQQQPHINGGHPHQSPPSVVIYAHPNQKNIKRNKLQYLRGKSMSWKDPFGEPWDKRMSRYREQSPFGDREHWGMQSVIFKSGEDMRQEQMAMQYITLFEKIWKDAKLPLQLRPYSVIVTSPASGFVETVPNAVSISRLKHAVTNFVSLRKFFEQFYGPVGSPGFNQAQKNFVESMAGYSLVCYFLQIKDRHNGNILLTAEGKIVHIDFDFLFSNSPGGNIGFESAPFKLTEEFIEVMGGEENSEMFDYFKILLIRGFLEARKHVRKFVLLSKIMLEGASMPCFLAGKQVISQLQDRFARKLKNEKCVEHVYNLIEESSCNWRSVQYDKFQRITNNIL